MDRTMAIKKEDKRMAKRGYVDLICQVAWKNQGIIVPCTDLPLGKFNIKFFNSDAMSRLTMDGVEIIDPDGKLIKFARDVRTCDWTNEKTWGSHTKYHVVQVRLPDGIESFVFGVYYKAERPRTSTASGSNHSFASTALPQPAYQTSQQTMNQQEIPSSAFPTYPTSEWPNVGVSNGSTQTLFAADDNIHQSSQFLTPSDARGLTTREVEDQSTPTQASLDLDCSQPSSYLVSQGSASASVERSSTFSTQFDLSQAISPAIYGVSPEDQVGPSSGMEIDYYSSTAPSNYDDSNVDRRGGCALNDFPAEQSLAQQEPSRPWTELELQHWWDLIFSLDLGLAGSQFHGQNDMTLSLVNHVYAFQFENVQTPLPSSSTEFDGGVHDVTIPDTDVNVSDVAMASPADSDTNSDSDLEILM